MSITATAIEKAVSFLSDNLVNFKEARRNEERVSFNYDLDGQTCTGSVSIDSSFGSYLSSSKSLLIKFDVAICNSDTHLNKITIRKKITNEIIFNQSTKERLEKILETVKYSYVTRELKERQQLLSKQFKEVATGALSDIGIDTHFSTKLKQVSEHTSYETEIKSNRVQFTVSTNDINLIAKLRDLVEQHEKQ